MGVTYPGLPKGNCVDLATSFDCEDLIRLCRKHKTRCTYFPLSLAEEEVLQQPAPSAASQSLGSLVGSFGGPLAAVSDVEKVTLDPAPEKSTALTLTTLS